MDEQMNNNPKTNQEDEIQNETHNETTQPEPESIEDNPAPLDILIEPDTSIINSKEKKKKNPLLKIAAFFILFTFLGGLLFGGGYVSALYFGDQFISDFIKIDTKQNDNNNVVQIRQINPEVAKDIQALYTAPVVISDAVGPSVVTITSTFEDKFTSFNGSSYFNEGSGSGIIFDIDNENLFVVTNHHVIDGASKVDVTFMGGDTFKAEILGYDSTMDIAVLSIDLDDISEEIMAKIAVASFGNSDELKVGELAVAIGSPLGKAFSNSITVGVISAVDRVISIDSADLKLIQTDAAINPGNSGGALVNTDGLIVGINTAKYIDTDVEGMGFAIPINTAQPIIEKILKSKDGSDIANHGSDDRPFLGVGISDITEEIYIETGVPFGVYVTEVYENSGADEAGIKPGDVIFAVGNDKVLKANDLITYISTYKVGDTIPLSIARDSEMIDVKAKLYKYSEVMETE
ncbi:MAG: protease [Firmicutes bacterium HGW-Firmicutes-1]|jgi:serine protease Do|nr:MAG: protease [Firmicutes bacterium HGW-Firmicutes-1]